ncbi:MAG TPA: hypothetical protein DCY89_08275 [Gammaproteobacteria bacterium]|nr:hypothetical protein [Gammaproteobacteria bacterium]
MTASRAVATSPGVTTLALLLASAPAHTLDLGPAAQLSTSGQPLHIRAEITGPGSERRLNTAVRCLEGDCARLTLRSFVAGRAAGRPAVVIRSFTPVHDTVLRLELMVGNGEESVRSEFRLELAPDVRLGQPRSTQANPVSQGEARQPSAADQPAPARRAAPRTGPLPAAPAASPPAPGPTWVVQPGQTLSGIAARLARLHGGDTKGWSARLHAENPAAFIGGDRDRLRAGAALRFGPATTADAAASTPPESPPTPAPMPEDPAIAQVPVSAPARSPDTAPSPQAVLADEGKALRERLARLEARLSELQRELGNRESAIAAAKERLGRLPPGVDTSRAEAPDAVPTTADARDAPTAATAAVASARSGDAAPALSPSVNVTGPAADVAPSTQAAPAPAHSGEAAASSDGPRFGRMLPLGVVFLLLVLLAVLLLRGLARQRPARRGQVPKANDSAIKQQIRERLSTQPPDDRLLQEQAEEVIDPRLVDLAATLPSGRSATGLGWTTAINEDEVVTEADVKIVYGLFEEAEAVLAGALAKSPESARLLLKLGEVRFYRRDADALVALAEQVLAHGPRHPAWLWAKIERLGQELCPERAPFSTAPARPNLRSVG